MREKTKPRHQYIDRATGAVADERLLADGPARQQMLDGLREVRDKLTVTAGASASTTAAREVLKILQLEKGRRETQAAQSGAIGT